MIIKLFRMKPLCSLNPWFIGQKTYFCREIREEGINYEAKLKFDGAFYSNELDSMSKLKDMIRHRNYEVEIEAIFKDAQSPRYSVLLFDEPEKLSQKRVNATNSTTT